MNRTQAPRYRKVLLARTFSYQPFRGTHYGGLVDVCGPPQRASRSPLDHLTFGSTLRASCGSEQSTSRSAPGPIALHQAKGRWGGRFARMCSHCLPWWLAGRYRNIGVKKARMALIWLPVPLRRHHVIVRRCPVRSSPVQCPRPTHTRTQH